MMVTEAEPLLDPRFIRRLEALRRHLIHRAPSGAAGEQIARHLGSSAEFQEHRGYVPGDDIRKVDWSAYARSGEPVVKLFRSEQDTILRFLIDASASVSHGNPSKLRLMQEIAAALSYMALNNGQRVQIAVAGGGAGAGQLRHIGAPARGRSALSRVLAELTAIQVGGAADLASGVEQLLAVSRSAGGLVVLSDFFDDGPVTRALSQAQVRGHDVLLVQVLERGEAEPEFGGDVVLVDSETQQTLEVSLDAGAIHAYLARLQALEEQLRSWARRHNSRFTQVISDQELEVIVRQLLAPP